MFAKYGLWINLNGIAAAGNSVAPVKVLGSLFYSRAPIFPADFVSGYGYVYSVEAVYLPKKDLWRCYIAGDTTVPQPLYPQENPPSPLLQADAAAWQACLDGLEAQIALTQAQLDNLGLLANSGGTLIPAPYTAAVLPYFEALKSQKENLQAKIEEAAALLW